MARSPDNNSGNRMPQPAHGADVQAILVGSLIAAILLLIVLSLIRTA